MIQFTNKAQLNKVQSIVLRLSVAKCYFKYLNIWKRIRILTLASEFRTESQNSPFFWVFVTFDLIVLTVLTQSELWIRTLISDFWLYSPNSDFIPPFSYVFMMKNLFGHNFVFLSSEPSDFKEKPKLKSIFQMSISPLRFGPNGFCTINNSSNTWKSLNLLFSPSTSTFLINTKQPHFWSLLLNTLQMHQCSETQQF